MGHACEGYGVVCAYVVWFYVFVLYMCVVVPGCVMWCGDIWLSYIVCDCTCCVCCGLVVSSCVMWYGCIWLHVVCVMCGGMLLCVMWCGCIWLCAMWVVVSCVTWYGFIWLYVVCAVVCCVCDVEWLYRVV